MNSTVKGIIVVAGAVLVGAVIYTKFFAGFQNESDAIAFLVAGRPDRSATQLKSYDPGYVKAWANALKKGEAGFKFQGENYTTSTGKKVN